MARGEHVREPRPGAEPRRGLHGTLAVMSVHPVVDVSDWEVRIVEPGGSDANVWLRDPESNEYALFKPVVAKVGRRQGEDWAEKAVEQVAAAIGVPAARIRMARRNGRSGLLSYDLAPPDYDLHTGAVLIGAIDGRLVPRAKERLGHNLENIKTVLSPLPATSMPTGLTAFDQFCGYLVLDALVANRDRHEENWAVLRSPTGDVTLAPSYDHGNSLGFNLEDQRRERQLERDPELLTWAGRGTADRFEGGRTLSLVEFAYRAMDSASTDAGDYWLGRLAAVPAESWAAVISDIPEMSEACSTFCIQLLTTNQRRLLDGYHPGAP